MRVVALILAAGESRRLGQPKQLVRVLGETLLERTLRIANEAGVDAVFVVLGAHSDRIAAETSLAGSVVVQNAAWQTGMASSIHAGMRAIREQAPEAEAVLLLVCDQARLTAAHLRRLLDAAKDGQTAASVYGGVPGVPAVFPAPRFAALMELRGDAGARSLLKDAAMIGVPFEEGAIDVDTEEDLRKIASDLSQP